MTNFTYNRDIPDGPDNPSDDQPDMQINTNSIDDLLAVDHVSFNTNKGGFHKQVHLINEAAPPLLDADSALFANTFFGNSWPVWQNALGGTNMLSRATIDLANGCVSLPGQILLQWGSEPVVAGAGTITFPVAFSTTFSFSLTSLTNSPNPAVAPISTGFSTSGIAFRDAFNASTVYWIAIGKQ